jgi:hypothetical protein
MVCVCVKSVCVCDTHLCCQQRLRGCHHLLRPSRDGSLLAAPLLLQGLLLRGGCSYLVQAVGLSHSVAGLEAAWANSCC